MTRGEALHVHLVDEDRCSGVRGGRSSPQSKLFPSTTAFGIAAALSRSSRARSCSGALGAVGEDRTVEIDLARDRASVRIDEQLRAVVAQPRLRLVRAVGAIAVKRPGRRPGRTRATRDRSARRAGHAAPRVRGSSGSNRQRSTASASRAYTAKLVPSSRQVAPRGEGVPGQVPCRSPFSGRLLVVGAPKLRPNDQGGHRASGRPVGAEPINAADRPRALERAD